MQPPPFHVLTGGPGSGKSSLIEALAGVGQAVAEETGRAIIRDQQIIDGQGLPWREPALFAELMLAWELRAHRQALALRRPVFFDRSLVDVIGYLRLSDLPVGQHLIRAAQELRYQRQVFVLPPWPAIYRNDAQRKQDFAEAERTCEMMCEVYTELGYQLIEVPRASLAQRRDFVLQRCGLMPEPGYGNDRA